MPDRGEAVLQRNIANNTQARMALADRTQEAQQFQQTQGLLQQQQDQDQQFRYDALNQQGRQQGIANQMQLDETMINKYLAEAQLELQENEGEANRINDMMVARDEMAASKLSAKAKTAKPMSAESAKVIGNVEMGITAMTQLQKLFVDNPDVGTFTEAIANSPWPSAWTTDTQQQYKYLTSNLTDIVGRLRSGGAINKDEVVTFKGLIPKSTDSDALKKQKAQEFITLFRKISERISPPQEPVMQEQAAPEMPGYQRTGRKHDPIHVPGGSIVPGDASVKQQGQPMDMGQQQQTQQGGGSNPYADLIPQG